MGGGNIWGNHLSDCEYSSQISIVDDVYAKDGFCVESYVDCGGRRGEDWELTIVRGSRMNKRLVGWM